MLIASRNQEHAAQALAALRAGKHVLVEKPMALTEDECRELARAVEESGCHLTVGFNRRFAPLYQPLQQKLAGRSIAPWCIAGLTRPAFREAIGWQTRRLAAPSWERLPLCRPHVLAAAIGAGECVGVQFARRAKKDPIGENNLAAVFQFADGSVGSLTYCTVGSRTSGGERVEAFTQGLGIESEDFKRLTVKGSLRISKRQWFAEKGYDAQMRAFLEGIRSGKPPAVTVRDGARATLGCLKILESARTGLGCGIDLDAMLR